MWPATSPVDCRSFADLRSISFQPSAGCQGGGEGRNIQVRFRRIRCVVAAQAAALEDCILARSSEHARHTPAAAVMSPALGRLSWAQAARWTGAAHSQLTAWTPHSGVLPAAALNGLQVHARYHQPAVHTRCHQLAVHTRYHQPAVHVAVHVRRGETTQQLRGARSLSTHVRRHMFLPHRVRPIIDLRISMAVCPFICSCWISCCRSAPTLPDPPRADPHHFRNSTRSHAHIHTHSRNNHPCSRPRCAPASTPASTPRSHFCTHTTTSR